jgi:ABC-2 type transport system ATP-binding protein
MTQASNISALSVKKVKKTYKDGPTALKGIDLEIKQGQFFGLLGPNGAGKSTFIHSVTGLVIPSSGTISVFGDDVVKEYQRARHSIGLSPQEVYLDFFLTVEETLDFHGGYFGMKKQERTDRIEELLDAFSLTEKRTSRAMFLSGGMKRRLIIARALMHRPKFLILDEPTAGVDVELRHDLWNYMQMINEQGTTILLTTHYIEEAEKLCDQIAMLIGGKIVYQVKTLEAAYLKAVGEAK